MAIIPQRRLFSWKDVENLGDLERLELVLRNIPDEGLMRLLEAERGRGRDDYPIRAVWNSVLAGIVYEHPSIESLRRELLRNDRLRWMCGFDPLKEAEQVVPTPSAYSHFLGKLIEHQGDIDAIFDDLVEKLREVLEGLGRHLACDSKGIWTHARPRGKDRLAGLEPDGRRDLDADWGVKTYTREREDGTQWEEVKRWFGYKLHLVVDAEYELPVAYEVSRASRPDNKSAVRMLDGLEAAHPELLKACEAFMADKGYDDGKLLEKLWRGHRIRPVIPKRQDWKDGETTRPLLEGADNIVYDCQGQVYCVCRWTGEQTEMVYWGYEEDRDVQKWRCPAARWGYACKDRERCGGGGYGRIVRVARSVDPRTFTPVARPTLAFERLYKKRTAAERVNSRLDVSYGFERHFIRGLAKMRVRCSLALVVMLAMALGRIRQKQKEKLRSLVGAV
jgi:hypothetical protein